MEMDPDNAAAATGCASWWRGGGERVQQRVATSDDGMHAFVGVCGARVTVDMFTDVFIIITRTRLIIIGILYLILYRRC